jgi:hypothetical protein
MGTMVFGAKSARRYHPCCRPRTAGSVLLGVATFLCAISIAAAFTFPVWQRSQRTSRARATVAAVRQFEAAFQQFAHDQGDWPPGSVAPGGIPAGMEAELSHTRWQEVSPIGGRFVWLTQTLERGERVRAAISIVSTKDNRVSDDKRQLDELSRLASDGSLNPNRLRFGYRNEPVYVLEH